MRITSETQYQQALLNIQSSFARINELQGQIASGKRVQIASDDPSAMSVILRNKLQDGRITSDLRMIDDTTQKLQATVDSLTQVQDILTSVKNVALQANNATTSAATYDTMSNQVNLAINQLLSLANQKLPDGSYMFGGTASSTPPFAVAGTNSSNQPTSIAYRGSLQDGEVVVSQTIKATTLISGNDVFQSRSRTATAYIGSTGAAAGTGTDSANNAGSLTVKHLLTTYSPGSGVAAGTSSATGDTIIGPSGSNTLTINDTSGTGASGTVSLNGGPAVPFTNADTNLQVTGPDGAVVSLDTSSVTPGFTGSVAITATGTMSVDGGATTVPIDFSANQVVTNGSTGQITNVDSTNIRRAGTDQLHYSGTMDLFQTLMSLRDTIANKDGLSAADRSEDLQKLLGEIDRSVQHISNVVGGQAVQAESLSNLKGHLTQFQVNLTESTDNLEAADATAAIVDLQQQMNLYQASLQVAVQLNSLTLLNFLN